MAWYRKQKEFYIMDNSERVISLTHTHTQNLDNTMDFGFVYVCVCVREGEREKSMQNTNSSIWVLNTAQVYVKGGDPGFDKATLYK